MHFENYKVQWKCNKLYKIIGYKLSNVSWKENLGVIVACGLQTGSDREETNWKPLQVLFNNDFKWPQEY